jgi:hypothetical protein
VVQRSITSRNDATPPIAAAHQGVRDNRSSQLPPDRAAKGWTVGDRGCRHCHGSLVYCCKKYEKRALAPIFPGVIAPITGEGPRGTAPIPARAGPGRPRRRPQGVRSPRHPAARADQGPFPDRERDGRAALRRAMARRPRPPRSAPSSSTRPARWASDRDGAWSRG